MHFITGLSSVEAYNIKSNEWFHVAPMNTRRSSVGVGVVGGKSDSSPGERFQVLWAAGVQRALHLEI